MLAPALGGSEYGALVYDGQGNPHAVYADATDRVVRHAWRQGGVWQRELVDGNLARDVNRLYEPARLVVDAAGALHALYAVVTYTSSTTTIEYRYATNASGSWQVTAVGTDWARPDLAVDASNAVRFAYFTSAYNSSATQYALKHQVGAGPGAQVSRVLSWQDSYDSLEGVALWIDGAGQSWIAFDKDTYAKVQVAAPTGPGAWAVSESPLDSFLAGYGAHYGPPAFGVDAQGNAHLLGSVSSTYGLQHAFGGGLFWSTEAVGLPNWSRKYLPAPDPGGTPRLMVEGWDTTYVGGFVGYAKDFHYAAVSRDGGWDAGEVLPFAADTEVDDSSTWEPGLAGPDGLGRPVVFGEVSPYENYSAEWLVELDPAGQVRHGFDPKDKLGAFALAVDPAGAERVAYVRTDLASGSPDSAIHLAARSGGGWSDAVPGPGRSSSALRLALGSDGLERTALFGDYNADGGTWVEVLGPDGDGGWAVDPAASHADGTSLALALDGADQPHLAYLTDDYYNPVLRYAGRGPGGWSSATIATFSTGFGGGHVNPLAQITVDGQGTPYVLFFDSDTATWKLARPAGAAWAVATFAYDGNYYGAALFTDAQGRVCAAHAPIGASGYELVVDCLVGGAYQSELVSPDHPAPIRGAFLDGSGRQVIVTGPEVFGAPDELEVYAGSGGVYAHRSVSGVWDGAAVAVDPQGKLRLAWPDPDTAQLKVLREP